MTKPAQLAAQFSNLRVGPDPLLDLSNWIANVHTQTPLSEAELLVLAQALSLTNFHPSLLHYTLRAACGYEAVPGSREVVQWLSQNASAIGPILETDLRTSPLCYSDWSVTAERFIPPEQYADPVGFTQRIWAEMHAAGATAAIGGYNHIRPAYGGALFATGQEARTVHIGLDVFVEAGSPVWVPLDGTVHSLANNAAKFDYGPCVVLEHRFAGVPTFYTLYGHLSLDSLGLEVGQTLPQGALLGRIGKHSENGHWPPHLHLQIILDMLDKAGDFYGSCHPTHRAVWLSLCPDANLIARVPTALFPVVPVDLRCGPHAPLVARSPSGQAYDACGQRRAG